METQLPFGLTLENRFYTECDKCGGPVPLSNDVATLTYFLLGDFTSIFTEPRHLVAVEGCEGSPSRAQYIEGQPKDTRPEFAYDNRLEAPIRDAYKKMQTIKETDGR